MDRARYAETDFFDDFSLVEDPYPYFEYLRSQGPVVPLPRRNTVAVVGFDEALAVHLDTEHLSAVNSVTGPIPPLPFVPEGEDISAQIEAHRATMPFGNELLTQDPPRHPMLRSLLMRLFTPGRDFLVARDGAEMTGHLHRLREDPDLRADLAAHGLATIHARHSCAHRVDELLGIVDGRRAPALEAAA